MPDVQQTLMGLSILMSGYSGFPEAEKVLEDAIVLLRKKEPVKVKYSDNNEEYWGAEYICPECDSRWQMGTGITRFCPSCGQPVIDDE